MDAPSRSSRSSAARPQRLLLTGLSVIAAAAYCSWPLGYLTDPVLVSHGLASDLEARGIPYFWLYVTLDLVCGALTVIVAALGFQARPLLVRQRVAFSGYALFGIATAVDAFIPLHCSTGRVDSCGANLSTPNLDDWLTGAGMIAIALGIAAAVAIPKDRAREKAKQFAGAAVAIAWGAVGLVFLDKHFSSSPAVSLQHAFLTMTAVLLAVLPVLSSAPAEVDRPAPQVPVGV